MNLAKTGSFFDFNKQGDIQEEADIMKRIEFQEFAYWAITSVWDIQESYNPEFIGNEEWKMGKPATMEQNLPDLKKLVDETIP